MEDQRRNRPHQKGKSEQRKTGSVPSFAPIEMEGTASSGRGHQGRPNGPYSIMLAGNGLFDLGQRERARRIQSLRSDPTSESSRSYRIGSRWFDCKAAQM